MISEAPTRRGEAARRRRLARQLGARRRLEALGGASAGPLDPAPTAAGRRRGRRPQLRSMCGTPPGPVSVLERGGGRRGERADAEGRLKALEAQLVRQAWSSPSQGRRNLGHQRTRSELRETAISGTRSELRARATGKAAARRSCARQRRRARADGPPPPLPRPMARRRSPHDPRCPRAPRPPPRAEGRRRRRRRRPRAVRRPRAP